MPEPEVQQLHNVGPTVARWRVPDVIFFLYLSIVFCLGFPILPYALSFYWQFVLRPLHVILFFRGSTPPGNRRGSSPYDDEEPLATHDEADLILKCIVNPF